MQSELALGAVPGSLHGQFAEALDAAESRHAQLESGVHEASLRRDAIGSKAAKSLESGLLAKCQLAKRAISKLRKQIAHPGRRSHRAPPGWGVGFLAMEASGYVNQIINWLDVFSEVGMSPLQAGRWGWVIRKSKMPSTGLEPVVLSIRESREAHEHAKGLVADVRDGRALFTFAARDADGSALQLALANADKRITLAAKWVATAELACASHDAFAANPHAGEGARAVELSFMVLDSYLDTAALVLDTLELRLEMDARHIFDAD